MKERYRQFIIDFHQGKLPLPFSRGYNLPSLPKEVKKVFVFIGMRRSGKTWLLFDIINKLLSSGLKKEKILYINFEDDRLIDTKSTDLQYIIDAYFELYPQYAENNDLHFFFDEIQEIDGWEKFIRRLVDNESIKIYVTGSSAKMLSKEIASSMRGRTITREVFPFSFKEYIELKGVKISKSYSLKQIHLIKNLCNKYLQFGGFPEIVNMDESLHIEIVQNYVGSVIYRDIVDRHNVSNAHLLRMLIKHIIQNAACLFSVNKIYNYFKSIGMSVGKNSLYDYIKYLEDAYCIFSIPSYNLSLKKSQTKPQKIYVIDQGLINAYSISSDFDKGISLENLIFVELRRRYSSIFYYNTKDGKEIDFLTLDGRDQKSLFQVSWKIQDPSTRNRELSALYIAMEELKIENAKIITWDHEEKIIYDQFTIDVIPAWKFLLN